MMMKMTDLDGDGKISLQDYEKLILRSLENCGIKIYE
jgi:Ca2+-binding EF-hand superfamily protein